jgi:Pumilio-family RNA binding repeat
MVHSAFITCISTDNKLQITNKFNATIQAQAERNHAAQVEEEARALLERFSMPRFKPSNQNGISPPPVDEAELQRVRAKIEATQERIRQTLAAHGENFSPRNAGIDVGPFMNFLQPSPNQPERYAPRPALAVAGPSTIRQYGGVNEANRPGAGAFIAPRPAPTVAGPSNFPQTSQHDNINGLNRLGAYNGGRPAPALAGPSSFNQPNNFHEPNCMRAGDNNHIWNIPNQVFALRAELPEETEPFPEFLPYDNDYMPSPAPQPSFGGPFRTTAPLHRPSFAMANDFPYRNQENFGRQATATPDPLNLYQKAALGGRQSPAPSEFGFGNQASGPWNQGVDFEGYRAPVVPQALLPPGTMLMMNTQDHPIFQHGQVHATIGDGMNYRRLLDRNMDADWNAVVDRIIAQNDQQASIFLQQKIKTATTEQRDDIIQAIIDRSLALMTNRFGNFLVQRCFENGTLGQIMQFANAICGNTLRLATDPFGCHVVQKAFDYFPEDYKRTMVHELLRAIPETTIHRYACHVWQKLFELRWSGEPPQIMAHVNIALHGKWTQVALGETGSLVVQNIFENCIEEDKRPCLTEVLNNIDTIARGQFGNWCIQHICEHGDFHDRNDAVQHVLNNAVAYSCDQYASKVVEKCLKIGGNEFLEDYLHVVCRPIQNRPRLPLIDIAGDQYGNYLVQWILNNANSQFRDLVAGHINKHLVSLRGSKYGSRVAMLASNSGRPMRSGPASSAAMAPRYSYHHGPGTFMSSAGLPSTRGAFPGGPWRR